MAGDLVRPSALPPNSSINPNARVPADDGASVYGPTLIEVVNQARPFASRPVAEAGVSAVTDMNPLNTKQSIAYEVGRTLASKAQGDKADTAVQSVVAGGGISVDATDPLHPVVSYSGSGVADGDKGDVSVSGSGSAWRISRRFTTLAAMLSDTQMSYSAGPEQVSAGQTVAAEGWRFEVAASGSAAYDAVSAPTGYHLVTAGGVKLFVLPTDDGTYNANAFAVTADGSTDDTVALRLAIEFSGHRLTLGRAGTIRLTGSIERKGDLRISNPNGTVILADSGSYPTGAVLKVTGSAAKVQALGANVSRGATTISAASASSFAAGDIGVIYNPTNGSFLNFRDYYRAGEFLELLSVSGTTLKLRNPLYAGYAAASVDVYKIAPVTGYIDNLIMRSNVGAPNNQVHIEYGRDFVIRDPVMRHVNDGCIWLDRCFNCAISPKSVVNVGDGNPSGDYGIVVGNSQHIRIEGGSVYGRRHPITIGGGDFVNCVPVRDCRVIGVTLKNEYDSGATCGDFHGNSEDCAFHDCQIYNGASLGGKNNGYYNCQIRGGINTGTVIYGSEILGGTLTLSGCEIEGFSDPLPSSRGLLDFGGNTTTAIAAATTEDILLRIVDNTIKSRALSAGTDIVLVGNGGTTKKISVEVRGNLLDVNNFASVLRVVLGSGVAASDFIVVDENICSLSGKYSLYPDGTYSALQVLRLQATRWAEQVTLSTGASFKAGTPKTFKWRFPRNPSIIPGRIGLGYAGNRIGVPYIQTYDGQAATLAVGTDDGTNFSSAQNVTLVGEAMIREA